MTNESYFKKNGYIYGVEGDLEDGQGYKVYSIEKFEDYDKATQWINENNNPNRRRFLATYTAKRYYESVCLIR